MNSEQDDGLRTAGVLKKAMVDRGVTQAEMAKRLGLTEGRVSQILSEGENLTLQSIGRWLTALDYSWRIEVSESGLASQGSTPQTEPTEAQVELLAAERCRMLWGPPSIHRPIDSDRLWAREILEKIFAARSVSITAPKETE